MLFVVLNIVGFIKLSGCGLCCSVECMIVEDGN